MRGFKVDDGEVGLEEATYEGTKEEMVVVSGGGVVEQGGMVGVTGVSEEKVFGGCVLFSGLCYTA